MSFLSDALKRAVPRQAKRDFESIVKSATIGNQLLNGIDIEALPPKVQLYIKLHDAEDDYVIALSNATKQNIGDVIISELLSGHVNVADDERKEVLSVRDEAESFLAAGQ